MIRRQAFRFELRPTGHQQSSLRRFSGSCRYVYNKALALQKTRHSVGERKLGYAELCKHLTAWRHSDETEWLAEAPVHPLQQSLKDLERAYQNFFAKRTGFPRFKKKGLSDSFRYPDPKQIKLEQYNHRIFLPKLGWIRYRNSRKVEGTVKNVTVSRSGDRWYVSVQTERDVADPVQPSRSMVGVDLGVVRLATLSDGAVYETRRSFNLHARRLVRAQRAMARKTKFSKNWRKAKERVSRVYRKIANIRRDHLHKTTTTISQNHAIVCIEDLKVKNMSASARGNEAKPGKNVRAKSGLNRAILDQGWYEFRRQLEYKQAWRGGRVLSLPPGGTSRTCLVCGHEAVENRRSQAQFVCCRCGFEEHADLVGAVNILRAGHARLACGERA